MTKLFVVSCDLSFVVAADDETSARRLARQHASDDLSNLSAGDFTASEMSNRRDLPDGWDDACAPYGGDLKRTIGEILGPEPAPTLRAQRKGS